MANPDGNVFHDFAARVGALPPDAWVRMSGRVPELEGESISALLARSDCLSDALGDVVPAIPHLLSKPLTVFGQLAAEFRTPGSASRGGRWLRDRADLTPANRRMVEGLRDLTDLLDAKRADHAGAVAALQVVMLVLPVRERINPGEFERLYAFLEPEIPLDSLKADDDPA